jgi:hypothetical protein
MKDKPYSKETMDLAQLEGFINVWHKQISKYTTYEDAYEATEVIHVRYFGKRRYKSYDSFKNIISRRNKAKTTKVNKS